jgi:hypothetical protein
MKRSKTDIQNKALVRFYKQLPSDVKNEFKSFSEFYDELREIDEDVEELQRQSMKSIS